MTAPNRTGPAPIYGVTMTRHIINLDAESLAIARALGGGNLSGGIREALRLSRVFDGPSPTKANEPCAS